MSFNGKVVIVTGASSGIGAATAVAFAAEGANLAIVGRRNQNKLNNIKQKCEEKGSKVLAIIADTTKKENVKRILDDTLKHFGKLDVLVNNAGIYIAAGILAPNAMEVHEQIMSTNLEPTVYLTHLAAPHLIETKGNIVNVSSIAAMSVVVDKSFSYLVSKAAIDHFTRSIALELAPKGVRVNAVNPGAVKTNLIKRLGLSAEEFDAAYESMAEQAPLKRFGEPEEIADLILFLASDKARSITGSTYVSDNGALLSGTMASI